MIQRTPLQSQALDHLRSSRQGPTYYFFPLNSRVPFSRPADCQNYEFMNSIKEKPNNLN